MNFTYLKTFVIVCESGNFTEAADKLFIPQPTVSNRIRYLEKELNQDLFVKKQKGKRSITLTRAGEKFLVYAQKTIETFDSIKKELNGSLQHRTIKIGSAIPPSHPLVCNKIKALLDKEGFNIHVSTIEKADIVSEIIDNKIDLAFVTEAVRNQSIKSKLFCSDHFELIIPSNHFMKEYNELANVDLLKDETIILFKNYPLTPKFAKQIYQKCKHIIVTDNMDLIRTMLHDQIAVTFLPSSFIAEDIEGKIKKIPISEDIQSGHIHYYMLYHQEIFEEQDSILDSGVPKHLRETI